MKILLIGGSSDLGRELACSLPYSFTNLDILNNNPHINDFIQADISNINSLTILKTLSFDQVIHISGIHPIIKDEKAQQLMYQVNVQGVFNVLQTLKDTQSKNFILISSSSAKNISSDYGKTKLLAEQTLETFCRGHNFKGYSLRTRGFTPYYSKYYSSFIDYANWALGGAVHIKDVVGTINACFNQPSSGYAQFLVDGKDDLTASERANWNLPMLLNKYVFAHKLLHQLTIKAEPPVYSSDSNPVNYSPVYGINQIFTEAAKLNLL